jgi:hypothetical protein
MTFGWPQRTHVSRSTESRRYANSSDRCTAGSEATQPTAVNSASTAAVIAFAVIAGDGPKPADRKPPSWDPWRRTRSPHRRSPLSARIASDSVVS